LRQDNYPIEFAVDYPERNLDRLTTLLRPIVAIPILIVAASVSGGVRGGEEGRATVVAAGAFCSLDLS
jgi:hypothetical protein